MSRGENAIAPPPVAVRNAPGALQRALLDSLALAVADIASDAGAAQRVGAALKRAIEHIVEDSLKGLASAVGRQLLGVVQAHVGDAAAEALGRVAVELTTPDDAALLSRITNSADSDVVDLISHLAAETLRLAGRDSLILTLDNVDRLAPDDLRRLADLATHLPDGVRVRAGFATWSGGMRNAADQLMEAGAGEISLSGLGVEEVACYLAAADLSKELAATVHSVTNGYPFYLEDAVALLLGNGANPAELSMLQPRDILARRTARSWRDLDPGTQTAAFLLAGFQEPFAADAIPEYLGITSAAWSTMEARLRDAGVFTGKDRLWFHELRHAAFGTIFSPQRNGPRQQTGPYRSWRRRWRGANCCRSALLSTLAWRHTVRAPGQIRK